jgi:hypothetical protein
MVLSSVLRNGIGFLLLVAAVGFAWPGVRAVKANEQTTAPSASSSPATMTSPADATSQSAADVSQAAQASDGASYEGFVEYMSSQKRSAPVAEASGPACGSGVVEMPEVQHQRVMAQIRARMIAEMQKARAAGVPNQDSDVVVLNGRGYNYRADSPGAASPPPPTPPEDR